VCYSRPKVYTDMPNFMCSLCRYSVLTFWGLLYRPPLTDEGQICCAIAHPRYTLTCQISSGSVYSVALCWRKTPFFAVSWTSAFSVVASWQQSDKGEHGCTTTNLPLPVSVLQRLHGEIGHTISDVQKRDEQTGRQTNKKTHCFWLPRRRMKSEPYQTWGLTHSCAARGR